MVDIQESCPTRLVVASWASIAVAQVVFTPLPTVAPPPTATIAPAESPPVVEAQGGIGTTTIVILVVVGIVVSAGVAVVGQGLWSGRRQA